MEKPKCRNCGHKHYSNEPHVFKESEDERSVPKQKESLPRPEKESPRHRGSDELSEGDRLLVDGPLTQVQRNQRWREKNRDHYNKYMRDHRRNKK